MTTSTLTRSTDRKTANAVAVARTSGNVRPSMGNAFGLPAGRAYSCPGATDACDPGGTVGASGRPGFCYGGPTRLHSGTNALLARNWDALVNTSRDEMIGLLDDMLIAFETECDKRDAPKLFRIHWDGDFFSAQYVCAWFEVIAAHPEVTFWAYTRVATAATYLHARRASIPNLSLYFSADADNVRVARTLAKKGIRIAYAGPDFATAAAELPGAVRCPENNGALPLIAAGGSACARCGLCIRGKRDVLFSVTKK